MAFVDVKNDVAFKKIFGNEKKTIILISFLNAILDLQAEKEIQEIEILNPYQLPRLKDFKTTVIDVKAKDKEGKIYIIEMQMVDKEALDKRLQYYASRAYTAQLERGMDYHSLQPLYLIGIFNFNFTKSSHYLSHHKLIEVNTGEQILNDLQYYFVELPKFQKPLEELQSNAEKWVFFIQNASNLEKTPENLEDDGLKQAYQEAHTFSWSPEEMNVYEAWWLKQVDLENERKKMMKTTMEETAKKLKNEGVDTGIIVNVTGLSKMEIDAL